MNILEAKREIARTFRAYTRRRPDGSHAIPPEKQRPVLLIGPPGIGKTAIMGQIAGELDCGLVAYSMTHHTRQSAIGLPFIARREYGGQTYSVTEYTMSEIVAAVYDEMARSGHRRGILFLDEINCVSETLTPVMLQLLQNKTFGNVPLPEDWILVAAGNPPEYNKSVREMDMATLDRVKHIEVAADLSIWQRYACARGVHPAIRTYLAVYPDHFYRIEDAEGGQRFVTARGWEDLSLMLYDVEGEGFFPDADWFLQYLQHDGIARSFGLYYELFRHFSKDGLPEEFSLPKLLLASPDALSALPATRCLAISAMLFHTLEGEANRLTEARLLNERRGALVETLPSAFAQEAEARAWFDGQRKAIEGRIERRVVKRAAALREEAALKRLEADAVEWRIGGEGGFDAFELEILQTELSEIDEAERVFARAVEDAYRALAPCEQGQSARLYLTSDLRASEPCAALLERYPSETYRKYLEML